MTQDNTQMVELLPVIQADRDAAAKVRPYSHNSALILAGERDGTDIVQAAAHARLLHTPEPATGLAEQLRELVFESLYHLRLDDAARRYHEKASAALATLSRDQMS